MALPTLQDAKDLLRIVTDDEDGTLTSLLARAKADIETWCGYPMIAAPRTYVDYERRWAGIIELPGPFALSPLPTVTDVESVVVDATTYLLDNRNGKIRAKYGTSIFRTGPYTVVATIGLSAHPDYATRLEAVASTAILDLVAHRYENRNPMLGDDLGQGINSATPAIPPRIQADLMALPGARGMLVA